MEDSSLIGGGWEMFLHCNNFEQNDLLPDFHDDVAKTYANHMLMKFLFQYFGKFQVFNYQFIFVNSEQQD